MKGAPFNPRSLTAASALGLFLATALPVFSADAQLPETPVRFWGEVIGAAPAKMEAMLVPQSGSPVTTCAATLTTEGGRRFYAVDWPGESWKKAVAAGGPFKLNMRCDGAVSGKPLLLEDPQLPPAQLLVIDGGPALPQVTFASARVDLSAADTKKATFTAVVASTLPQAAAGTLVWKAADPAALSMPVALELKPGAVTVSRLTTQFADGNAVPALWTATWSAADARVAMATRRVLAREEQQVLIDTVGGGPAPADSTPLAAASVGVYSLGQSTARLEQGEFLALELETSASPESAVRTALSSWTLSGTAAGAGANAMPLDVVRVVALPGGGSWLEGFWRMPVAADLGKLVLSGPPDKSLDGTWKLRRLVRFDRHQTGGNY